MWNGQKNPRHATSPMANSFKGINNEEKSAWIVDQLKLFRFLKLPTNIIMINGQIFIDFYKKKMITTTFKKFVKSDFCHLGNFFLILGASDCLLIRVNQSEVSKIQKSSPKRQKIWYDKFFENT